MARGPRPRPTALKILAGETRPCRLHLDQPVPPPASIEPPAILGEPTTVACEKWRELAPMLASVGVLTAADRDSLTRYCLAWERYAHAMEACRRGLEVVHFKNEAGKVVSSQCSPFATLARRWGEQLDRLADTFGMNPTSRSRLTTSNTADKPDPIAQWLADNDLKQERA